MARKRWFRQKRGVGRLVLDTDNIPMAVPFVHTGMQDIMPIGAKFPRIGKTVMVLVGDPIQFDDLLGMEESKQISRGKLYDSVASRIGHRLQELKNQFYRLVLEQQALQLQCQPVKNSECAMGILQQVDWESFGMGSHIFLKDEPSQRQESLFLQDSEVRHEQAWTPASTRTDGYFRMGLRGFVDPSEFMGFAARGLNVRGVGPSEAWKRFLEGNAYGIGVRS